MSSQARWTQYAGIPLNVAAFLLLMLMSWGSFAGFFAHPARTGVFVVHLLLLPVMTLCTSGRSRGAAHARDDRLFFPFLVAHTLFTACVMPYMDARGLGVLPGGDALRWTGLMILALGAAIRAVAMLELGPRFSSVIAAQQGHALHTTGTYRWVRHPSYLGLLLVDLGFAGVFRSAVGLALLPLVFAVFHRRMQREEAFLCGHFGEAYRIYQRRTARLHPGIY